jgi:hypothetical protein
MALTETQTELISNSLEAEIELFLEKSDLNTGAKLLYLERAKSMEYREFNTHLDRLFQSCLMNDTAEERLLKCITALKQINNICQNHPTYFTQFSELKPKPTITYLIERITATDKLSSAIADAIQLSQDMVQSKIDELKQTTTEDEDRSNHEENIQRNINWREPCINTDRAQPLIDGQTDADVKRFLSEEVTIEDVELFINRLKENHTTLAESRELGQFLRHILNLDPMIQNTIINSLPQIQRLKYADADIAEILAAPSREILTQILSRTEDVSYLICENPDSLTNTNIGGHGTFTGAESLTSIIIPTAHNDNGASMNEEATTDNNNNRATIKAIFDIPSSETRLLMIDNARSVRKLMQAGVTFQAICSFSQSNIQDDNIRRWFADNIGNGQSVSELIQAGASLDEILGIQPETLRNDIIENGVHVSELIQAGASLNEVLDIQPEALRNSIIHYAPQVAMLINADITIRKIVEFEPKDMQNWIIKHGFLLREYTQIGCTHVQIKQRVKGIAKLFGDNDPYDSGEEADQRRGDVIERVEQLLNNLIDQFVEEHFVTDDFSEPEKPSSQYDFVNNDPIENGEKKVYPGFTKQCEYRVTSFFNYLEKFCNEPKSQATLFTPSENPPWKTLSKILDLPKDEVKTFFDNAEQPAFKSFVTFHYAYSRNHHSKRMSSEDDNNPSSKHGGL